jgi:DNA-binding NarL/FixJ family response regulator
LVHGEESVSGAEMQAAIRVMVVETHEQERRGLAWLLHELPGVGEAVLADRAELGARLARDLVPDLALVSVSPGPDGVAAIRLIKHAAPSARVIAFSSGVEMLAPALAAGADGFVDKMDLAGRMAGIVSAAVRNG